MGVAGAGKSLQGRLLADEIGLPWLSTGEFLRMLISGQRRKDMQAGMLLDDQEVITLVRKIFAIVDTDHEFVLDGFPRTAEQADWLLSQVKHGQLHMTAVIHLTASRDGVRERLLARGRQDDHEEAIEQRFQEYENDILQLIQQFKDGGVKVYDVNGEQPVEAVRADIMKVLGPINADQA